MKELTVIGAGILGATVAKYFREKGVDVLLIDAGLPMNGTAPSGGHLKPSWFGSMSKEEYQPSMELLNDVWGLDETQFTVWPGLMSTTVFRVDTDQVKAYPYMKDTVRSIDLKDKFPIVRTTKKNFQTKNLVICTGHWADQLFPHLKIQAKQGVSFRFKGVLKKSFIKPWAPYKQVVAHQQDIKEIWVGDGSAILEKNWTEERTAQCLERCTRGLSPNHSLIRSITGIRPYCDSVSKVDPCFYKKMGRNTWLATGAGKSGTISAGWVLKNLIEELKI